MGKSQFLSWCRLRRGKECSSKAALLEKVAALFAPHPPSNPYGEVFFTCSLPTHKPPSSLPSPTKIPKEMMLEISFRKFWNFENGHNANTEEYEEGTQI